MDYHYPLKVITGLIAVGMSGYALYGATLMGVNKGKAGKLRGMSVEEIKAEKVGERGMRIRSGQLCTASNLGQIIHLVYLAP